MVEPKFKLDEEVWGYYWDCEKSLYCSYSFIVAEIKEIYGKTFKTISYFNGWAFTVEGLLFETKEKAQLKCNELNSKGWK
jgi:hypothetical protein